MKKFSYITYRYYFDDDKNIIGLRPTFKTAMIGYAPFAIMMGALWLATAVVSKRMEGTTLADILQEELDKEENQE